MKEILQTIESYSYITRTKYNIDASDITAAFFVDDSTTGERQTKRLSKDDYVGIDVCRLSTDGAAKLIYKKLLSLKLNRDIVLNIAGNGLHSIAQYPEYNITQTWCNEFVYLTLRQLIEMTSCDLIKEIVSGGQTGFDLAGLVAAKKLGIDYTATFPAGFKQRNRSGIDVYSSAGMIAAKLDEYVRELSEK